MEHRLEPVHPDERFDPRLITASLSAAVAGWQILGHFFTAGVGLEQMDKAEVDSAVAYLLDQIYALADPNVRMDEY